MRDVSAGAGPGAGSAAGFPAIEEEGPATDAGVTEPTISGRVKWFDPTRGYGFVVPDDGGADVLLHANVLARHGCKALPEGAVVKTTVRDGPRGRQAVTLLDVDLSQAVPDGVRSPAPAGGRVDPKQLIDAAGDFEEVQVRWFNRARGYGFLLRSDGETQIFVHMETVRRGGFETLVPGQALRARAVDGPRGALAVIVAPGAPPAGQ